MRRIKSAPANIAGMVNRKKEPKIPEISKINIVKNNIIKSEIKPNEINQIDSINEYKIKKNFVANKKKIKTTITGIISDSLIETNKNIPITDSTTFNYIIEFINNFMTNKFSKKNLENFILSLMIRFIASQVYHDIIIKIKENIHLIS